ncbi:MAG: XVIPCD domain-containing protein [Pseudomonadota bacterium]
MASEEDRRWVENTLGSGFYDVTSQPSILAERLTDPAITPERRDLLLQTMIRSDELTSAYLFGNDTHRGMLSNDPQMAAALAKDQRIIGAALGEAHASGAITTEDLIRLGDLSGIGHQQERVVALLQQGGDASRDALLDVAKTLSERDPAGERDRMLATTIFATDPETRAAMGPEKAREAFESLIAEAEKTPFDPHASNEAQSRQRGQLVAAASLYAEYGDDFLKHYTGQDGRHGESETLARFMSLTALDPNAREIKMPDGGTVGGAVDATTDKFAAKLFETIRDEPDGELSQRNAIRQLGRLHAGITLAEDIAEQRHADAIKQDAAVADRISGYARELVGLTPARKIPGLDEAVSGLAEAGIAASQDPRTPPDASRDGRSFDSYEDALGAIEKAIGPHVSDIQEEFNSTRETELDAARSELKDKGLVLSSLMDDRSHPEHARYASCQDACARANLGLSPADLGNAAGVLAVSSKADGLPTVDHAVLSRDGSRLFGIAGGLDDPSHLRTTVAFDPARKQGLETSTQEMNRLLLAEQAMGVSQDVRAIEPLKRGQMV